MYGFCRKLKIRKRNYARRAWKKNPLFAYEQVVEKWGRVFREYTYENFISDISYKKKPKPKKEPKQNTRDFLAEKHYQAYIQTGQSMHAIWASRHKRNRKKPFQIDVRGENETIVTCYLDVNIPYSVYKDFFCNKPKTLQEFEERYKKAFPYGRLAF